jgi:hypothetical protein
MNDNFHTIEPSQSNLSDFAVIEKVMSEENRLPEDEHEKAAKAFLLSDSIASGIARDFAFVKKIPQYIMEIIDNKLWECFYVAKGVVTPYYCRYNKSTDSDNFRAFITAKRPNGLETSVDIVDNILNSDPEVQRQFRTLIYESSQGEWTDSIDDKSISYGDRKKLEEELSSTQQSLIGDANRAAEVIPILAELIDRGIIAIDFAAKLGRDIKDPENLTAEEREYVENRDLIGLRINQYIHSNPIPEDEYKEPAYSREFNRFIKDLLAIKDRSKQVRMDHPKKAADKLLQFYHGARLQALIDYLQRGLENFNDSSDFTMKEKDVEEGTPKAIDSNKDTDNSLENAESDNSTTETLLEDLPQLEESNVNQETQMESKLIDGKSQNFSDVSDSKNSDSSETLKEVHQLENLSNLSEMRLTSSELAERFGILPKSLSKAVSKHRNNFSEWSKKRDPERIGWQRSNEKRGNAWLFIPVKTPNDDSD